MKRIYIAGPMTGLPEFNYPAFNAEAARIRALGYHVENPAENPDQENGAWEDYMKMALRQMLMCDTVAMLPGWGKSKGALIEYNLAKSLGLEIWDANDITR